LICDRSGTAGVELPFIATALLLLLLLLGLLDATALVLLRTEPRD
jgi:Flp pilus assembly protein TadG